jgi:hypothetical protein
MNNQNEKMHFDDNEKEIVDGWSTYTEMMPWDGNGEEISLPI